MSAITIDFVSPLQYSVVLWQEPDEPEWWYAKHPEYESKISMFAAGRTQAEALAELASMKEDVDDYLRENGEAIPQPGEHLTQTR